MEYRGLCKVCTIIDGTGYVIATTLLTSIGSTKDTSDFRKNAIFTFEI